MKSSYRNFGKLPEDVQEEIDPELASKYAKGNVVKAKKKKGKKSRFEREQEAQRKAIEDSNKNPEKGQSRSDSISEFDFIDEKTFMGGGNVTVTAGPGKPFYSSASLKKGYEETLPSAASSAMMRKASPLGKYSPRAAIQDGVSGVMDMFRDEEGKRGSRIAKKVAKEGAKRNYKATKMYKHGGSVCRGSRLATAGKKFSGVY